MNSQINSRRRAEVNGDSSSFSAAFEDRHRAVVLQNRTMS
jgi:hypothetical protein